MSLTQLYIYNLLDMLYWVKAIDFSGLLYSFWGHNTDFLAEGFKITIKYTFKTLSWL